jgi:hypothetical protein
MMQGVLACRYKMIFERFFVSWLLGAGFYRDYKTFLVSR